LLEALVRCFLYLASSFDQFFGYILFKTRHFQTPSHPHGARIFSARNIRGFVDQGFVEIRAWFLSRTDIRLV
jgi:hypothetical protein